MSASTRASRSRRVIDGRIAAATTAVGSTLYSAPMRVADQLRERPARRAATRGRSRSSGIGAPKVTNARDW